MMPPEITTERAIEHVGGESHYQTAVKMSWPTHEVNLLLVERDIASLTQPLPKVPDQHAIQAGESCGCRCYWSQSNGNTIYLTIGNDDQTWDACFTLCLADFMRLREAISQKPSM